MIQLATLKDVIRYATAFKATGNLTANTSETVFAAGSNTAGAIVWRARGQAANTTSLSRLALAAHTAAPNAVATGDVIASTEDAWAMTSNFGVFVRLDQPIFIAAGKGLFWTSDVTDTFGFRTVLYTLLA